jgi:hypothetical protein
MIRWTTHNPFLLALAEQTRFLCVERVGHAPTLRPITIGPVLPPYVVIWRVSPRKWFGRATWAGTALTKGPVPTPTVPQAILLLWINNTTPQTSPTHSYTNPMNRMAELEMMMIPDRTGVSVQPAWSTVTKHLTRSTGPFLAITYVHEQWRSQKLWTGGGRRILTIK